VEREPQIEIAKRNANECNIGNINYVQATIFDERYQKESFDVILAFRILHMLADIQAVMHRINKLLKPGGSFYFGHHMCGREENALLSILVFIIL